MKRRNAVMMGNVFMGLGMLLMIAGIAYSIANQLPELNLPGSLYYVELLAIFPVQYCGWRARVLVDGKT